MYRAPISEISFLLENVANLKEILDTGKFPEVNEELVFAIFDRSGKIR